MSAIEPIIIALGSAGGAATLLSTVQAWLVSKRSKADKPVTIRITRNDGSSIFLNAETVKSLDPDMLKLILAEILPAESEEPLDLSEDAADEDPAGESGESSN